MAALLVVGAFVASLGCVLVTGSTDGYREADAPAADCADAQIVAPAAPDAAIGDAGATVGECVACIARACPSETASCQGECACRERALGLLRCLESGRTTATCSTEAFGGEATAALLLFGACVQASDCPASACSAGGDAGP
ncbi:MAG: hypothetical protein KF850_18320 [Labilithrix sp.]|nr:hypothetical protein [Labilithrix sp.]MBX3213996.1 hypothetical protein [Labilithrix sp.]